VVAAGFCTASSLHCDDVGAEATVKCLMRVREIREVDQVKHTANLLEYFDWAVYLLCLHLFCVTKMGQKFAIVSLHSSDFTKTRSDSEEDENIVFCGILIWV
jgi:hypothetical protein